MLGAPELAMQAPLPRASSSNSPDCIPERPWDKETGPGDARTRLGMGSDESGHCEPTGVWPAGCRGHARVGMVRSTQRMATTNVAMAPRLRVWASRRFDARFPFVERGRFSRRARFYNRRGAQPPSVTGEGDPSQLQGVRRRGLGAETCGLRAGATGPTTTCAHGTSGEFIPLVGGVECVNP